MKKIHFCFLLISALIVSSCGLGDQKKQIETLGKCKFEIKSISDMTIAGTSVNKLYNSGTLDMARLPNIAIAALQKNIPLDAVVNLEVQNPTDSKASVDEFDYIILIDNSELANGTVTEKISVNPNETTVVPVRIKGEVYNMLFGSDKALLNFLTGDKTTRANFTIKVKPTLTIAGQKIKYPGFITLNKELSREILFK